MDGRRSVRPLLAAALLVSLLVGSVAAVHAADTPSCFGAAARDPRRPCVNPALRYAVTPSPAEARDVPDARCNPVARSAVLFVCGWGTPPRRALRTVALIGDSHAAHWRPALEPIAEAKRWRMVSMSHAGCPLTMAPVKLPDGRSHGCDRWNRAVRTWLADHPEVSAVVVAQHRIRVRGAEGDAATTRIEAGYVAAWRALLAGAVRHVIVMRETPRATPNTAGCIEQAVADHRAPGPACAIPRDYAIVGDPAFRAARALRSPQVQTVDLTALMCSSRLCPPVIGGALVHRDLEHLTRAFAATLAPYLQARLDTLMGTWPDRAMVSGRLAG